MEIKIKHKLTGAVLFSIEADSLKLAVRAAIEAKANLSEADLHGADLCWSNLRVANLHGADLRWSNLRVANLSWSDLSWSNLREADLRGADLRGAVICTGWKIIRAEVK